jgi:dTMP kinase
MDRHLYCQLALRRVRQLPRGRFLPWLLRLLPEPDLVVHFDIAPEQALERILLRATDTETLEELEALSEAYRVLPEFSRFVGIDAGAAQDEVLAALTDAINGLMAAAGAGSTDAPKTPKSSTPNSGPAHRPAGSQRGMSK